MSEEQTGEQELARMQKDLVRLAAHKIGQMDQCLDELHCHPLADENALMERYGLIKQHVQVHAIRYIRALLLENAMLRGDTQDTKRMTAMLADEGRAEDEGADAFININESIDRLMQRAQKMLDALKKPQEP